MNKQQMHEALDVLIAKYEELTHGRELAITDLALAYTCGDEGYKTTKIIVNAEFCAMEDDTMQLEEYSYAVETWADEGDDPLTREARAFEA